MQAVDDPLDQLVPRVRPWWQRLVVGGGAAGAVFVLSVLWQFGHVYPQPDCCGVGGDNQLVFMRLADDGRSVEVSTWFFNGSQRPLRITGAHAELPGAEVLSIGVIEEDDSIFDAAVLPLPTVVGPEPTNARVVIRFVPRRCAAGPRPWGSVELDLDVDGRLALIGRTYRLPDAVVPAGDEVRLQVLGGGRSIDVEAVDPLAVACRLLGR